MDKKIINLLDNFFDWIDEKDIHIGDLEFCSWVVYNNKGRHRKLNLDPDCEHCHFCYEYGSYEGECIDCGCYIDHDFNVSKLYCAIPWKIKMLIKEVKGWE